MAANDEMKKIKVYEMFFNIKTDIRYSNIRKFWVRFVFIYIKRNSNIRREILYGLLKGEGR